jgi:hypothetical protein
MQSVNTKISRSTGCNGKHDETSGKDRDYSPGAQKRGMRRLPFKDCSRAIRP